MWMDLEGIILSEVRKRKTNTVWFHLHMGKKTKQRNNHDKTNRLIDTESKQAADRGDWGGNRREKGYGDENTNFLVVHMHHGLLHSHIKEHIWVSPDEVDEPRACYTQGRSQKEKNKYILMHTLEKNMAARSSILARRIPWTEEPGELQSMGSQRVRHDWVTDTFFQCMYMESRKMVLMKLFAEQ